MPAKRWFFQSRDHPECPDEAPYHDERFPPMSTIVSPSLGQLYLGLGGTDERAFGVVLSPLSLKQIPKNRVATPKGRF